MKLLKELEEAVPGKNVAITLGAGVDPDGLASQAGMAWLISILGGQPHLFCRGSFNRPQNRTMSQELGLHPTNDRKFNPDAYDLLISVDGPAETCPARPDFIIDHHQQNESPKIADDVRIIGSCSAIIWEYLMHSKLDWETEDGKDLATALALGIMTDTKNGATDNCSELDFEALSHCMKHKNNTIYKKIVNFPKPAYYNDLYVLGWKNKIVEGAVLVSGLGNLTVARSGVISDLAEKYSETEGISTAVVFAMVDGNIDISVRSTNSALNVDEFVKHAFGGGGGKRGAGRCLLDIPLFQSIPDAIQSKLFEAISETIIHKALQFANDGVREEPDKQKQEK